MASMTRIRLPFPEARSSALFAVGFQPIVLTGEYDPNQHWLPFVRVVVAYPVEEPSPSGKKPKARWWETRETSKKEIKDDLRGVIGKRLTDRWNDGKRINIEGVTNRPYLYEKDVDQYTLPFHEFREISHKDWKRLAEADFPSFERRENNELYSVTRPNKFSSDMAQQWDALKEWCRENATGRFYFNKTEIVFQHANDCIAAKLFL